jgi:hypothetical protein
MPPFTLTISHSQPELGQSTQEIIDILSNSLCLDQRKAASLVMDHLPKTQGLFLRLKY